VPGAHLLAVGYPAQGHGSLSVELFSEANFKGFPLGNAPSAFGLGLCLFNSWASKRAVRAFIVSATCPRSWVAESGAVIRSSGRSRKS
jgi:hypothetical protein